MRQALAKSILSALPRLRRYAAAVTGSSRAGDRYIELCLETLIQEPNRLKSRHDLLGQLYELLHEAIDACGLETEMHVEPTFDGDLRQSIFRLDNADRRLLLLILLEGFSLDRAAKMLAMPATEARSRLVAACASLHDLCVARILVIEDKKSIANDLVEFISQSGHTLVGVATDIRSAAALAQQRHPDLVVADLRHSTGRATAVQTMLEGETMPVIFLGGQPAALCRSEAAPVFVVDDLRDERAIEDTINRALFSRVAGGGSLRPAAGG